MSVDVLERSSDDRRMPIQGKGTPSPPETRCLTVDKFTLSDPGLDSFPEKVQGLTRRFTLPCFGSGDRRRVGSGVSKRDKL